jgi:CBS domain containing-hemolysin-like protein
MVMAKRIFKQALEDDSVRLKNIQKDIYRINKNIPVSMALNLFIKKKEHMFLVQDRYGQTEGIVTLEDCVETILGLEIMDESDTHEDMREVARHKMRVQRRGDRGL